MISAICGLIVILSAVAIVRASRSIRRDIASTNYNIAKSMVWTDFTQRYTNQMLVRAGSLPLPLPDVSKWYEQLGLPAPPMDNISTDHWDEVQREIGSKAQAEVEAT